ncbi:L-allo-threonine aldolase [Burkholderia pseudomallei MSHR4377]|uniref:GntG family PLP-dependent aldolase n=1 Tax=Burkholderia pseudomallei TaxID=28450 RepID=UPI00050DF242|nr:GntG family PLP-dependent aldolase [Burkholderia pseudomallei]KGC95658.1 L-allo-threonine aldolase [Burkholderia pseudomallei]KGU93726.1 L-allo-threonine aldolase [Burkholderia pseudomallei MSHR4377]KGX69207.1 beta-eliminating lyase family protein [Burkholderia pseudomallei TSV28]
MSGKPIQFDFLSDTVTLPTTAMRQAMDEADVGDDVYGEDPSTNRLESYAADLLGKEAACWLPSGTMANLSAILAQCERGRELFVGDDSDLYNYEAGGVSVVGGIVLHPLATNARGEIPLDALQDALRDADDTQCAPPGIVAIETPHVRTGGTPLSLDYLHALRAFCDAHCLALHIDGARVFNAAIALRVDAKRIAAYGDTLQFCLSKSLAAPAGSIVVSDRDTIARVRRWRKLLGGGMRQIGVVTAAGEVALRTMVERLADDHAHARRLADGLAAIDGIELAHERVQTNMVFFKVRHASLDQRGFLDALAARGVRMAELGHGNIRAVTHYHHAAHDIDRTLAIVREILSGES